MKRKGEMVGLNYFFKTEDRMRATVDTLRYLEGKGVNGVTFSTMKDDLGKHRVEYVGKVLIPNGYVRKQTRFRKQMRESGMYYQRTVKYYLTSEGEDLILELENKYKEHKMKALYGRIL
jgi:hypothetical protein